MKPWDCKHCLHLEGCARAGTAAAYSCFDFESAPVNRQAIAEVMEQFCTMHETDAQYLDRQVRRYGFVKMARPGNYFSEE